MTRTLALKSFRDLRAMGLRALMIMAVVGVGPGAAAGVGLGMQQVRATRAHFYRSYALADIDVRLRRALPARHLLAHANAAGASVAQARTVVDGAALAAGEETAAELVGMSPRARLDRLALIEGRPLSASAPRGALLEAEYARHRHLRPGQRLTLVVRGRRIAVPIRGIVRSPEYLLATANPDYLLPQPGSLAVLFLPRAGLQAMLGIHGANDLIADFPGGVTRHRSEAIAAGLPVAQLTPISQQYSRRFTEADVHSFSVFAPVMGIVFAAVALLLITLSLHRLVHSQRRELGALAALGYRTRAIVGSVLLPAAAIGLTGAAVAVATAIGVGALVASQYSRTVGFPETVHALNAGSLLLAAGLAIGSTLLAAALPALKLARLRPTEALRGQTPASFRLPGWLTRATASTGTASSYAIRSLLRRPAMTAATVLSLAAAIGLGGALEVLLTSTNASVQASFAGEHWDYAANLARPLPAATAAEIARRDGAGRAEPIVKGSARLTAAAGSGRRGASAETQLVGLPAAPRLRSLTLTSGGTARTGAVVLSEQLAAKLGVRPGARVTLASAAGRTDLRVAGIARTLAGTESYLPAAQASRLLGLPGQATAVAVQGGGALARRLREDPAVARVSSRAAILKGQQELMAELTGLLDVLLGISLGVGALFLISSLAISHLDREGELATLRALGHGRRQIAAIVFGEALAQTVAAAALSVPLALLIAWPLQQQISKAWFHITLGSRPYDFLVVILPGLALALISAVQASRRLLRIDIAGTVRARLIG